jgi:hypothetical protein
MSVITIRRGRATYGSIRAPIESSGDGTCASVARAGMTSAMAAVMVASHRGAMRRRNAAMERLFVEGVVGLGIVPM